MKKRILVLLVVVFMAGSAQAAVFEYEQFNDFNSFAYRGDRTTPATVDIQNFKGDNRLHFGLNGATAANDSFHRYEGIWHATGQPSMSRQSYSMDLHVDSDWGTTATNIGLWAKGTMAGGKTSAYPVLAYRSGAGVAAGFYTFDYTDDSTPPGWHLARAATAGDFDSWHSLRFDLIKGTGVEYFVDGVSTGIFSDSLTIKLAGIFLQAYNYGHDGIRDYYFDNFKAQATPIPGAIWLLGSGIIGLIGLRKKKA